MDPGFDSVTNRNEHHGYLLEGKGGRCVGLTTLPPSCADCMEIVGASNSWSPGILPRPVMGLLYLFLNLMSLNLAFTDVSSKSDTSSFFEDGRKRFSETFILEYIMPHLTRHYSYQIFYITYISHVAYKFYRADPGGHTV
jgi:hypothetical protein